MTPYSHPPHADLRDTAPTLSLILRLTGMLAERTQELPDHAADECPEHGDTHSDPEDERRELVAAAIGRAFEIKRRILDVGVSRVLAAPGRTGNCPARWRTRSAGWACWPTRAMGRRGRPVHRAAALDEVAFDGAMFDGSSKRSVDTGTFSDGGTTFVPVASEDGTAGKDGKASDDGHPSPATSALPIAHVSRDTFRIQLASDLHVDVAPYRPAIAPDVDAIVVAGDVRSDPDRAVRWLEGAYGEGKMVTVLENDVMHVHGRTRAGQWARGRVPSWNCRSSAAR